MTLNIVDANTHFSSAWVRSWSVWKHAQNYFPVDLVKTAELPPDRNYLICAFPHGILRFVESVSPILGWDGEKCLFDWKEAKMSPKLKLLSSFPNPFSNYCSKFAFIKIFYSSNSFGITANFCSSPNGRPFLYYLYQ